VLLVPLELERDVVVSAVGLEPYVMSGALLPPRALVAHELDLLPEVVRHARGGARSQLDDGGDDLDHPAVEVDGAAGRELERAARPPEERGVDERLRILPVGAGIDLDAVEDDVDLRLHARDGHVQAPGFTEAAPPPLSPR